MKTFLKKILISILLSLLIPIGLSFSSAGSDYITWSSGGLDFSLQYDIQPDIVLSGDTINFIITGCISGNNDTFTGLLYFANVTGLNISEATGVESNGSNLSGSNGLSFDRGWISFYSTNIGTGSNWNCLIINGTGIVDTGSFSSILPEDFGVTFWTGDYSTANLYEIVPMSGGVIGPDYVNDNFVLYPKVDVSITKNLTGLAPQKSGDYVDYEFAVFASGATGASNLILKDFLPTELTCISGSSNFSSFDANNCSGIIDNIPQNTTGYFYIRTQANSNLSYPGILTNTGELSAGSVQTGLSILNSSVLNIAVAGIPDLYVNITTGSNIYESGDIVEYNITIGNSGTDVVNGSSFVFEYSGAITDPVIIPQLFGQSGVIDTVSNTITRTGLNIGTGSFGNITITGLLSDDFLQNTIFNATGTINMPSGQETRESNTINDNPTNNIDNLNNYNVLGRPDLTLSKTFTSESATAHSGDDVVYVLNFDNNNGTATATGIQIRDFYDTGYFQPTSWTGTLSCVNITGINGITGDHSVVFDIDDMSVGCSGNIILTGTLIQDIPEGYTLANTGVISTNTQELHIPNDLTNTGSTSFGLDAYVDITTIKTLQEVQYPNGMTGTDIYGSGDIVKFLVTITNSGNSSFSFSGTDTLNPAGRFTNAVFEAGFPTSMGSYSTITGIITATVIGDDILNTFTNTIILSGTNFSVVSSGVYTGSILGRAHLSITKEIIGPDLDSNGTPNEIQDGPYYPGDEISFKITVTNTGTNTGIVDIQDILPNNVFSSTNWSNLISKSVAPNSGNEYIFTGIIGTGVGTYINTGIITGYSNDPSIFVEKNSSFVLFSVHPKRELLINKEFTSIKYGDDDGGTCNGAGCPVYGSGDELTFTLTVTNTGNAMITGLTVRDTFPSDFVFVSSNTGNVNTGINFVEWTGLTLGTGNSSFTIIYTGRLTNDIVNSNWTNTGTIITGTDWVNNVDKIITGTDSVVLNKTGRAHLSIIKTVLNNEIQDGPYYPGDEITFHFDIANTGTRVATGINLNDVVENSVLNLVGMPMNDITVPVGGTGFDVVFTVAGNTGQYLGEFTNTGTIVDSNGDFVQQGTIIENNSDDTTFHIRPRTELSIEKTYCGMNGDCNNPRDPYGQRYNGERQKVGFRITIHNSGNIQATGIDISDILPNVLSGYTIQTPGYYSDSTNGHRTGLTINSGSDLVLYITGQLNTETPQQFTNTSNFDETNHCSSSDYITTSQGSGCQIIVNSNDIATGNILGMAHIGIQKITGLPGQCRQDPRMSDSTYPMGTGLSFVNINGQTCLPGPAMPGDTIGFRVRVYNTGTRDATGLNLQDLFPNGTIYPSITSDDILRLYGNTIYYITSTGGTGIISYGNTLNAPTFDISAINVPQKNGINTGFVDFYITGYLYTQTGYDVNQIKTNTGIVSDPLLQSGVVVGTDGTDSDNSQFEISEYMQTMITKTTDEPAASNGVLSGDIVGFSINFANIGNTGTYFQIVDSLPDVIRHTDSDITTTLDSQWDFTIPSSGTCGGESCDPTNSTAQGSYDSVENTVSWFIPVKYLSVNGYGEAHITGSVVGVFGAVQNNIDLSFDDSVFNHSQYQSHGSSPLTSRAQIEFNKVIVTNGATQAGDLITFRIDIINTGRNDIVFTGKVVDWMPGCLTVVSRSNVGHNWSSGNNVSWEFNNNPITIPGRPSTNNVFSLYLTGRVKDNAPNGNACFSTPNGYFNTSCMSDSLGDLVYSGTDPRCDGETGHLLQGLFSIEKTMISPNPRFTGDDVVFQININNNSTSVGTVTFNDIWPNQTNFIDYVSDDGGLTLILGGIYSGTYTIPGNSGIVITMTGSVNGNAIPDHLGEIFINTGKIIYNGTEEAIDIATGQLLTGIYVYKEILSSPYVISGSLVNFRLSFLNYSGNPINYYHIRDIFPQGSDGLFYVDSNPIPYNIDDLNNGDGNPERSGFNIPSQLDPIVINLTGQVFSDANGFSSLINEGKFEYFDHINGNLLYGSSAYATLYPIPDLQVTKELTSNIPQTTGDTVSYIIKLKNVGTAIATNIELKDIRPEDNLPQTNLSFYPNYNREEGGNYIWDISQLNPGQEFIVNISTTLTKYTQGGQFCNTTFAVMSGEYTGNSAGINTGVVCTIMAGTPDLRTKKSFFDISGTNPGTTGDRPQVSGDIVAYSIEFGNSGNWIASGRSNGFTGRTLTDNFDENFLIYDHFDNDVNGVSNLTLVSSGNGQLLFTGTDISANSNTGQIIVYFRLKDNFDSYLLNSNNCFDNNSTISMDSTQTYMERNTNNNTDTYHEVCVVGRPDLVIEKNIIEGSTGSAEGTIVRYEINYTNSGTAIATGRYIDDLLPNELTGYTFNPQPSWSGFVGGQKRVVWSGEDLVGGTNGLRPGQNGTIIIEGQIEHMLVADGTNIFCNTGNIYTGNGQIDMTGINNIDGACVVPGGGFYTHKNPASQPGVSGGLVQFEFGFENNTNQNVCISMSDNLSDYGFFCYDGPNCLYGDSGVVYTRENISTFNSGMAVFTAVVAPNNYNFGTLTNTAEFTVYSFVGGSCDWSNPIETHIETANVVPVADVVVNKEYTSERNPQGSGDEVNYKLTFKNIGGIQATGVRICDWFPDNITNISTNPGLHAIPIDSCKNGRDDITLNPGQEYIVNITSKLSGDYTPNIIFCNTGQVYPYGWWFTGLYDVNQFANNPDPANPHIDVKCVTIEGIPDVWSEKYFVDNNGNITNSGDRPQISGDSVFYRINYGNSGDRNVSGRQFDGNNVLFSGRTVEDIFPSFLTFSGIVSQNTNGAELLIPPIIQNNKLTFYGSGVLGANGINDGSIVLEFVLNDNYMSYEVDPNNCFKNTGNINMPVGLETREETNLNNISGSELVCVLGIPDLWINKEILTGQYPNMSGDKVVYRITYGNSGNAIIRDREIRDLLPDYLTGFEFNPNGGIENNYEHIRTGTHLGFENGLFPGDNGEIIVTGYLADNYTEGSGFCNTGFVYDSNGNDLIDQNTGNNISEGVCSIVGGAVDMFLIKTGIGTVAKSGDKMHFQLQYYNTGTKTATGPITIIDYLPSVFDFITGSSVVIHSGVNTTNFNVSTINSSTGTKITWNINTDLVYHASGMIDFEVMLNQNLSGGTRIINTGYIVAFDPEPDYNNNYDVIELYSSYLPEVAISKELIQNGSGAYGDEVSFALNFINNGILGSGDATGVWITDILPTGFNFTNPLNCSIQINSGFYVPGIGYQDNYLPYPGNPSCQVVTNNGIDYIQVQNLNVSGQVEGRVLLTGTLDFQPLSEFCFTNTGIIDNGYYSGSERIQKDYYTGNNISIVSGCMEPQFGVLIDKVAYPERDGLIDPSVGLDISGSTIGFEINILNNGEIAITGTSLYDLIQTSGLPTNYFTRLTSSTNLPPDNLLNSNIILQPGESGHYYLTGILNTRNRGAFYNSGVFTYEIGGENISVTGGILLEEPNVCGDYILSRQEECEQLSGGNYLVSDQSVLDTSGHLLLGLICNNSCQIEMDYFVNTAVMCDDTFTPPICLTGIVTGYISDNIPELIINKTAISGTYTIGDEVWYNIEITNTGNADAYNVTFTDNWPSDITITRIEPEGIINTSSDDLLTNLGTLQAGHTLSFRIYGTINSGTTTNISNIAYVNADGLDSIRDVAIILFTGTTTPPPPPVLEGGIGLTKTALNTDTLYSGDIATFKIVIENTGNLDARVLLTDTRPSDKIEFGGRSVDLAGITGNLNDGRLIDNLRALTGRVEFIMTGKVIVDQIETAINSARIQGTYLETTTQHGAPGDTFDIIDSDSVFIGQSQTGGCKTIGPEQDIQIILPEGVDKVVVPFTCEADDEAPESSYIELYCDNGTLKVDGNGKILSSNCEYTSNGVYHPYCKVNGKTQNSCEARVDVRKDEPLAICGNGILEGNEQCDLYDNDNLRKQIDEYGYLEDRNSPNYMDSQYSSTTNTKYYCDACSITRENNQPIITPPTCSYTDVPISIQKGEKLPFWRDLNIDNSVNTENDCNNGNDGKIIKNTMMCKFNIYRKGFESVKSPYKTITRRCDLSSWDDGDEMITSLKNSLEPQFPGFTNSINYALGNYIINTSTWNTDVYGEYKISLEKIDYDYCSDGGSIEHSNIKRVCQSNFVLTKPYLIQKGANTTLSDTSLSDFYNMEGDQIIDDIDLNKIQTTQLSYYNGGTQLYDMINTLFNKFDNDNITIETNNTEIKMKKVKGKNIFIVGNGGDDLITYTDKNPTSTPITVLVKGDLVIKGDIITPTMFVVKGKVGFRNRDCNKNQNINGIIISEDGFMSVIEANQIFDDKNEVSSWNISLDKPRCLKGGLYVKGVMIGKNINNILKNKRAHLNNRFKLDDTSKTIEEERRDEIYEGASVFIEHNPDLRLHLPPGTAYIKDALKTRR